MIIPQKEPQLSEIDENKKIGVKLQTNDKVRVLSKIKKKLEFLTLTESYKLLLGY